MRIVAENRDDDIFLVGMSLLEYIEQVKPIVDKTVNSNQNKNMYSEEDILRQYNNNINNKDINEMICCYYRSRKIFEVYVAIKRDLTQVFLATASYPFHHMWNGYSPYKPFYGSCYVKSIYDLSDIKFSPERIDEHQKSDYYNEYKKSVISLLSGLRRSTSIYLEIKLDVNKDDSFKIPTVKIIDRTGEILFFGNGRHVEMIRHQIIDYDHDLFFEILKELEQQKKILTCEGDKYEGDYTTTISIIDDFVTM